MTSSDLKLWPIFSQLSSDFTAKIRMALVFGNLSNEALVVTDEKKVYAWGSNMNGCLGTGSSFGTSFGIYPIEVTSLLKKDIKTFAYGAGPHVLALTNCGKVYSWGMNDHGQAGHDGLCKLITPMLVEKNLKDQFIIDVACGSNHSLALTINGVVYSWGQNQFSQGLGIPDKFLPSKVEQLTDKKVIGISCGHKYSMVITEAGEVYGMGCNGSGQLGVGNCRECLKPTKVTKLSGIVIEKIACGYSHTLALSSGGDIYVWGHNSSGQLGVGTTNSSSYPIKLYAEEMGKVTDIATTHLLNMSAAMGSDDRVFVWGNCRGQVITKPMLMKLKNLHEALACFGTPGVMHKPLIFRPARKMGILHFLEKAFDDQTTSDLTIQVEGKEIHVHKAILKIRSEYFRTMFQEQWPENNQRVIEHKQFSYSAYKSFLKYLYTDNVDFSFENAVELLEIGNVYMEPTFKKICCECIKPSISIYNVASWYIHATKFNAPDLEDSCFKFAKSHMTAVVQSPEFMQLDESMFKSFILKAAEAGLFKT